jgi:CRP-like cAMP-binding protein
MDSTVKAPDNRSLLIPQFENISTLSDREMALLQALEQDARHYPVNATLTAEGEFSDRLFMLKSGWACATRILADGQRQVLDIFLPGQILGLREMGMRHSLTEFYAMTDALACPFPKQRLTEIFEQSPKLTDLFFLAMAREQSMLIERVTNIGRRNALERLAHFIVEIKVRLTLRNMPFELPINQSMLGDTLGLSSVHISRTFKQLKTLGLLDHQNGNLHILDLEGLIELSGFDRAYLDTSPEWTRL